MARKLKTEEITVSQLAEEQCASVIADSMDGDLARAKLLIQQKDAKEALKRYNQLMERVAVEHRVIEDFRGQILDSLASEKLNIVIPPPAKPKAGKKTAEEAVLVISDTHIGKIVEPGQTLGFGHYNLKIFFDRLFSLEQTVIRMLQENIHNPIRRLHVLLLGDLIEGMLAHAQEVPMRNLVADQVLIASLGLYQFIARISRLVPITVRGVSGNHGRWPNQKKPPTENRYSNFDFIVMGQIQALLDHAGPKNVEVVLDEAAFQVFNIFGWRFKISHGDHLKGGDKAPGVPAHSIGREINTTTQRYAARGQQPPDYYIVGDKHRHMSVQTARGRYMVNGAFFEADGYAMTENFTPGRPFQMFFGVHPRIGKSWQYDIALDRAESVPLQYKLPTRLTEKVLSFS